MRRDAQAGRGVLRRERAEAAGRRVLRPGRRRSRAGRPRVVAGGHVRVRDVWAAASVGIPVVIVNQGATRGDPLATATVDAPLGATLSAAVHELGLASLVAGHEPDGSGDAE